MRDEPAVDSLEHGPAHRRYSVHQSLPYARGRIAGKRCIDLTPHDDATLNCMTSSEILGQNGTVMAGAQTNLFRFGQNLKSGEVR